MVTAEEMLEMGFYKVNEIGGIFVTGTFYNPKTGESRSEVLRDYDYADCSRDNDSLYHMEIDEAARRAWMHSQGKILPGDTVEVYKGRKVKKGTVGKVDRIREINDKYGRWVADYVVLEDGQQTNVKNCKIVTAA